MNLLSEDYKELCRALGGIERFFYFLRIWLPGPLTYWLLTDIIALPAAALCLLLGVGIMVYRLPRLAVLGQRAAGGWHAGRGWLADLEPSLFGRLPDSGVAYGEYRRRGPPAPEYLGVAETPRRRAGAFF